MKNLYKVLISIIFIGTFSFSQTNYCLNFSGSDDYVDCGNDASLNVTNDFTIEVWFKLEQWGSDASDTYNYIVSKIDSIVNDMEDASITLIDLLVKNK